MRNRSIEMLGRAGETIVANYFHSQNKKVKQSVDQYDSKKDMIVESENIEVKTQVPFVIKDAFSFKYDQLKKCLNADKVIFVSVPNDTKKHFSDGKVYCIKSKDMRYSTFLTKDGRTMILVPIDQEGMEELFEMTDEEKKLLKSYSVSKWN